VSERICGDCGEELLRVPNLLLGFVFRAILFSGLGTVVYLIYFLEMENYWGLVLLVFAFFAIKVDSKWRKLEIKKGR